MKKIINDPSNFVLETIEGICMAHPEQLKLVDDDFRCIVRKDKKENKVAIVTAGGSGHLPVFLGYVGKGLLDGCAVGDVFASPSASKMTKIIEAVDSGKGVLCLFGNYGGDKMNFEMAREEADFSDIETEAVVVSDDIASSEDFSKRRGVAGMVYAFKIAGAAAERGWGLQEVVRVTKKALENIRTMGVALSPCIVPTVGKPTFHVEEGKMEVGMGIHGEAGIEVTDLQSADSIATMIVEKISSEIEINKDDTISVMVNGLGATPLEEQYIVFRKVNKLINERGAKVVCAHVGEFATSMEMSGLSVTIFKLDDELESLLKDEAISPFYTSINKR